jgi:UDP-N-acetylmuramyl pentapeptide phosphotransferase/UDP-N-acetylglucosamine-1-phosphate transferase
MFVVIASFVTAFTLTYFTIPSIINIAKEKHLFDEPDERSSHTEKTPSLGGIAIFAGAIFSIVLWTPFKEFGNLQYILCSFIIIFLIGAKDDISPISPTKKIIGQILAASILVFKSDIELTGLYGFLGIEQELGRVTYIVLSIFTILVIVNAFNLIDGINGLAGSIGALIAGVLGSWFFMVGHIELAIVAFTITGSVLAFLRYNFTPARIFMGDTGSLLVGIVSSILIIKFIDYNYYLPAGDMYKFESVPAVAVGIMILPLFDTVRVFITRMIRKKPPFKPDRRHIHHLLIDFGLTHMQATAALVMVNVIFITLVFASHAWMEMHALLGFIVVLATAMSLWLTFALRKVRQKQNLAK